MYLREKNTYFQANERTNKPNTLVPWITTYHKQADAQIIPAPKQTGPRRLCSSHMLFSLLLGLLMQTVSFRSSTFPARVVGRRPGQCSNTARLLMETKKV